MAKDFNEAIAQIATVRKQKLDTTARIYSEQENVKRNQYLLNAALLHSQDGKAYQANITQSRRNITGLISDYQGFVKNETTLIRETQDEFGGYDGMVNQLNDRYPILFLPVRIETTFDHTGSNYQLWVRIYPDEIAVDTHEEGLTQDEIDQGQQYWRSFIAATDSVGQVQAWDILCKSYSAERAAWIALQNEPTNLAQDPSADDLIFPDLTPPKADAWTKQPETRVMPDNFVIYAYDTQGNVISVQTNNIPDELKIGIDPNSDPDDPNNPPSFDQDSNNDIVASDDVKWMIDFDAAIANGMGAKINITQPQYEQGFAKVLVLGVKSTLNATDSQARLQELIINHHYTDGFSLLKQGTGTNNTDDSYSGYSSVDFGNTTTYQTEREDPLFTPVYVQRQKTDGQILCEALGIDYDELFHIFHSNGTDINDAMNTNTVFFQSAVCYFVNEFVGSNRTTNNTELRSFFTDFVRARGALPSIRSGVQPYGILPASVYSRIDWGTDPNAGLYRNIHGIVSAIDRQYTAVLSQTVHALQSKSMLAASPPSTATQLLADILAQSPVSTSYVQRLGVGSGYISNYLSYAALAFKEKQPEWLQQQIENMHRTIAELGIDGLKPDSRLLQVNYLEEQSTVSIPAVADDNTPKNAPLPQIGKSGMNMLQLLNEMDFRELRDQNFQRFGIPDDIVERQISNNLMYRYVRQSLMLEHYEAACDLLRIPDDQRSDPELVNIVGNESPPASPPFMLMDVSSPPGEVGEMGPLSYGPSRLLVLETPYQHYATITEFLSREDLGKYPETQNLLQVKNSLHGIALRNVRDLDLLFRETIDTTTFRFDTWRLSLVNQRLNDLRGIQDGSSNRNMGIYLGAYGWVTDVKPDGNRVVVTPPTSNFSGTIYHETSNKGYIHAPSINQAVTGAVLRSGYDNRADQNMTDPLSINLSSERVRSALDIMDAISNGQELNVLLGYEFERRLHDTQIHPGLDLDQFIQPLRDAFSQNNTIQDYNADDIQEVKARNVVNGISLIDEYKSSGMTGIINTAGLTNITTSQSDAIEAEIKWIWDLMDAVGDIAMSEGMFQIVQGNQVKGGAVTDAISKGKLVAEPDVVDSNKTGTPVSQRFTMHFSTDTALTNGWNFSPVPATSRALSEPYANKWLISLLPAPDSISCVVDVNSGESQVTVSAQDIALQPIDLMYLVNDELKDDDSMLSLHIKRFVRKSYNYDATAVLKILYDQGNYSFAEVLPVLRYARKLLTNSRPLNTLDYIAPNESDGATYEYDVNDLHSRASAAGNSLAGAATTLTTALNASSPNAQTINNALYALSAYGIEQTVYEFYEDTDTDHLAELTAWGSSVLSQVAQKQAKLGDLDLTLPASPDGNREYFNTVTAYVKAVYGDSFVLLPKFNIRAAEQTMLNPAFTLASSLLQDHLGNNLLTDEWLGSIARVRKNAAAYEILSSIASVINFDAFYDRPIKALQLPYATAGSDRWLGASVTDASFIQQGYVAIGASMPAGNTVSVPQVGIMVEEWIDVIPNREETTGVSFHHDQPNAKAPQCLILGLTPQITGNWKWEDLVDMMNETFDLAQKRGVDYETIGQTPVAQVVGGMALPASFSGNVIGANIDLVARI